MGVFNIIETFFFLSLAITFVLILLLVNHFKQRINMLEQKCDTTFEIINNVLHEMGNMKNAIYMASMPTMQTQPSMYVIPHTKSSPEIVTNVEDAADKIVVSDEDSDGDDGDSDGDTDDGDDENDSDGDTDDESEDDIKIKIVNVDIQDKIIVEDIMEDELMEDGIEGDLEEMITEISEIPVIKVDKIDSVDEIEDVTYEGGISTSQENQRDFYNKMTVQELKKVVITKGFSSDVGKLKKNDLLKLLEQES